VLIIAFLRKIYRRNAIIGLSLRKRGLINLTIMQFRNLKLQTGIIMSAAVLLAASMISSCQKDATQTPSSTAALDSANALAYRNHHHTTGTTTTTTTGSTTTTGTTTTGSTTTSTGSTSVVTSLASLVFSTGSVINQSNVSGTTISGQKITGGSKPCITLTNCHDIHITQCYLQNSTTVGIYLVNCYNITIDYNFITNVSSGVYAEGSGSTAGGIVVNYNQFRNMVGPSPRGQFVQFNTVSGPGSSISYNKGENIMGSSNPEDAINLFMSKGTAASPIQVVGNWIRGGGPSTSGGGIMTGDNGGSYEYVANNILVNPGQYGLSIAGGDHISLVNNQVYATKQSFTNVGLYVWGQSGYAVSSATVSGNSINFTNSAGQVNGSWLAPGETSPTGWSSNNWSANLTSSIIPTTMLDL
jgi:hypothetical protein